jgi:hypothetical protein
MRQIKYDTRFLARHEVMDYSLLLFIEEIDEKDEVEQLAYFSKRQHNTESKYFTFN